MVWWALGGLVFENGLGLAFLRLLHQLDARGRSQGSSNRRQDGDGEVDDFLPNFLSHSRLVLVMSFEFSSQSLRSLTEFFFIVIQSEA